jgi:uncharacterized Zn finger protein
MTRESVESKGRRYLLESRLTVVLVGGDVVRATCRGSGELYELGHTPGRGWWCNCPARAQCAHLLALMAVTVREPATTTRKAS